MNFKNQIKFEIAASNIVTMNIVDGNATSKLAKIQTSEICLKYSMVMGKVNTVALIVTHIGEIINFNTFFKLVFLSLETMESAYELSLFENKMMPKVALIDSKNPTSPQARGFVAAINKTAKPSEFNESALRRRHFPKL